jgi:hypothetical protein
MLTHYVSVVAQKQAVYAGMAVHSYHCLNQACSQNVKNHGKAITHGVGAIAQAIRSLLQQLTLRCSLISVILWVTKVVAHKPVVQHVQTHASVHAVLVLSAAAHLPTVAYALKAAKAAYHTVWTISQLISVSSQAVIAVQE